MSDIFYSEVDPHLWMELNARAKTGRYDRSNESMNFMLEKIANVMVVPYKIESGEFGTSKSVIREAILGGHTVREGEYLPSSQYGFLTDRNYNLRELGFNADDQIIEKYNKPLNNTSRRIPPYITSVDMTNGDHSMSLLNSVTINFIVPNPERDLNYIESIYFRPGRNVDVIIEHPNSAVITMDTTKGKLSSDSLISAWERSDEYIKLKQRLDSSITEDGLVEDIKQERALFMKRLETFRHLNLVKFEGIIQSFTMDYQSDMSVQCTIQIIGTSNIYADIELIINSNNKSTGSDTETQNKTNTSTTSTTTTSNTTDPNSITTLGFFENLYKEVDNAISESNKRKKDKTEIPFLSDRLILYTKKKYGTDNETYYWAISGKPYDGADEQRYMQLKWLVNYINHTVSSKQTATGPASKIKFEFPACQSVCYPLMKSADPMNILFPDQHYYSATKLKGNIPAELKNKNDFFYTGNKLDLNDNLLAASGGATRDVTNINANVSEADIILNLLPQTKRTITTNNSNETKTVFDPTSIFINLNFIKRIVDVYTTSSETIKVSEFLQSISDKISSATGGGIILTLVTDPDDQKNLLWADSKAVKTAVTSNQVKPYPVPMFSNHPVGTIVRDFKFSGKLPQDATNLSYVLNSDPSEIAESDIAPYVSYMYTANTVTRSGNSETISSILTEEDLKNLRNKYTEAYNTFTDEYANACFEFFKDFKNETNRQAMRSALEKYIQYPTPSIELSNELAAPVIPFDVEFTIDGINGFRYGDILTFEGLPDRYKTNTVFCVASVTHTVGTDGIWTTTIRCIMRPQIN